MRLYSAMGRLPRPRSYLGKILLVSFVGVHVPMIGAVVYVLYAADTALVDSIDILGALLVATLVGTVATMGANAALLAPVREAARALRAYLATGTVPALPTGCRDEAGVLMANVQEVVTRLDLSLDAARAQRDEAVALRREKFEVLANLAHDLRTPLNHVIGFAELMSTEALGPLGNRSYRQYASDIGASGGDLLGVLHTVLELSAAESGRVDAEMRSLDIEEAVGRALNLARHEAERAGVVLEPPARAGVPVLVDADERALKQILLHLLRIAMQPSATRVALAIDKSAGDRVSIVVHSDRRWQTEDVPPELPSRRALRAANPGVDTSNRTALGLSLVASLLRASGGGLIFDAGEGGGGALVVELSRPGAPAIEAGRSDAA